MKLSLEKIFRIPRTLRSVFYLRYNKLLLKVHGVTYGTNLRILNSFYLIKHPTSIIKIGNNFTFTSGESFNPLCRNIRGCIYVTENASLIIGDNTGISSACLWVKECIVIGSNVKIGGDCILLDTDAHSLDYVIRKSGEYDDAGHLIDSYSAVSAPIYIEDDVLIGTRCIILKGVTIGARSIIGCGSVVTKDIPSDCIAAGNPCRVIRHL